MKRTIEEIIEAKKIAEAKINNIIAQFSYDNEVYNIDVSVEITKLFNEGKSTPDAMGVSTKINITL